MFHLGTNQHLEQFRCTQSYYSLAGRELEREMVQWIYSLEPSGLGPEPFAAVVRRDHERWGRLIRENNIKAD